MQSSTAVLFRALVMLACLVAVPLAAVVGSSLPDLARGLLARWSGNGTATDREGLDEAPAFVPGGPVAAPLVGFGVETPSAQAGESPWDAPTWGSETAGAYDPAVVPASGTAPLSPDTASAGQGWPSVTVAAPPPGFQSDPGWMDGASVGDFSVSPTADGAQGRMASAENTLPQPSGADGQFLHVQERLRQLGATYFALESWGTRDQLYRFQCKMAIDGNPNFTRHFEATDAQPLTAMAQVLDQVETWQSADAATSGW